MLVSLSISNYALIAAAHIELSDGFTVITGETGAGKSILLGALGLITGKRADSSSAGDPTRKCVIEGVFDVTQHRVDSFFEQNDLDYEPSTIIRREIAPSGKSRAFINDTPVTLAQLQTLGDQLVDIHSQHKTMDVVGSTYQFEVLDTFANAKVILEAYQCSFGQLRDFQEQLQELTLKKEKAQLEYDYQHFLFSELEDAAIQPQEFELLEEQLKTLSNAEEIAATLGSAQQLFTAEGSGVMDQLSEIRSSLQSIVRYSEQYAVLSDRVSSMHIELDDIIGDLERMVTQVVSDPMELERMNTRTQQLYNLMQKHKVATTAELLLVKNRLDGELQEVLHVDEGIAKIEEAIAFAKAESLKHAATLHAKRIAAIPQLESEITDILMDLGMEHARFEISLQDTGVLQTNGGDRLEFLFSANKGMDVKPLSKGASGGELSRLMLAVKSILSMHKQLPTLIFDEIDTGVSGSVAVRMAAILKRMGKQLQLVSITHLPQIAAQGKTHFKVYKEHVEERTNTHIVNLDRQARVVEIAAMLGGSQQSDAAIAHAKNLLG
ncbi:MAG: DNA repair protein RecN [Dokdonia sp.]|nr:DNA repair protein RecN [Dokdonia sp.]